ncbi:post-transcriptional regulator [Bacillus timonensis]|nr:post-transcriptional regulator [Bacillus timonensis]
MVSTHPLDKYKEMVHPALVSKLEEFYLFGYDKVTEEELWQFLLKKKWKKNTEDKQLHQIVNDVMRINIGEYMNYATVEAFKSPNWFGEDGKESLKDLL